MKEIKLKVALNAVVFVAISMISTFIRMYFSKNTYLPILCIGIGLWTCGLYFSWFYIFIEKYRMLGIVLLCIFLGLPISALIWMSVFNNIKPDTTTLNGGYIIINSIIYCSMFLFANHYARIYNEQLELNLDTELDLS